MFFVSEIETCRKHRIRKDLLACEDIGIRKMCNGKNGRITSNGNGNGTCNGNYLVGVVGFAGQRRQWIDVIWTWIDLRFDTTL